MIGTVVIPFSASVRRVPSTGVNPWPTMKRLRAPVQTDGASRDVRWPRATGGPVLASAEPDVGRSGRLVLPSHTPAIGYGRHRSRSWSTTSAGLACAVAGTPSRPGSAP